MLLFIFIGCQTPKVECSRVSDWRNSVDIQEGTSIITITQGCGQTLTVNEVRLIGAGFEADLPSAGTTIQNVDWDISVSFTPGTHLNGEYAGLLYVDAEGLTFDDHGKEIRVTVEGAEDGPDDTGLPPLTDDDDTGDLPRIDTCESTDLVYSAEIRDIDGVPCTACEAAPAEMLFYAVVSNTCNEPLSVMTDTTCLHQHYSVSVTEGPELINNTPKCVSKSTEWVIPPKESIEELLGSREFSAGSYALRVEYANLMGSVAVTDFTTKAPEKKK